MNYVRADNDWPGLGTHGNYGAGSLFAKVLRIPSASLSYDEIIAKQLWDESAELAKLSPLVVPAKAKKGSR